MATFSTQSTIRPTPPGSSRPRSPITGVALFHSSLSMLPTEVRATHGAQSKTTRISAMPTRRSLFSLHSREPPGSKCSLLTPPTSNSIPSRWAASIQHSTVSHLSSTSDPTSPTANYQTMRSALLDSTTAVSSWAPALPSSTNSSCSSTPPMLRSF